MSAEQSISQEQAALLSSAAAVDSTIAPVITHDANGNEIPQEADQQSQQDAAFSRNRDLLTMGITMLTPMLPFLPTCYPPATVEAIAAAFTAVEVKRGWNISEAMTPEVMLAVVAVPPTLQAFVLGRQYIAAMKEQKTAQNASNKADDGKVIDAGNQ